jgi:hypothetical protein
VVGARRKLHGEELHNVYSLPDIIRVFKSGRTKWVHACSMCRGDLRNAYEILIGNPEGKRSLGEPSRTCENSIKMDHRETRL